MQQYYTCNFFHEPKIENYENFTVLQHEIVSKKVVDQKKVSFLKQHIEYKCSLILQNNFDIKKPTLLIPTKDNAKLLQYTLKNLQNTNVTKHSNIIVIDDRSEEDLKSVCLNAKGSYLRIDNTKGFNFSMLNNIAAKICNDLGVDTIILWNSDLWCVKEEFFLELLTRHKKANAKISGSKLVYPPQNLSFNKEIDSENVKIQFPHHSGGKWRNTVQFGGDVWIAANGPVKIRPLHYKRFNKKKHPLVNCDKRTVFVTGALQVWELKYFLALGGLNPSLAKTFQDVDICLRCSQDENYPFYFGKDIHFYHDESLSVHDPKNRQANDPQVLSDHYLFGAIWNKHLEQIVI